VWYGVFAVWDGGLGIWGGIALATVVGLWRLRRHGVNTAQFMDAVAPALLVAQGIGRIGNYFNKELFGSPTSLPWGLEIPYQYRLSGGIPDKYLNFSTFQPTFLYELIFDFAWAGVLVWLGHHRKIKPPGLFALYVFGYSAYRISRWPGPCGRVRTPRSGSWWSPSPIRSSPRSSTRWSWRCRATAGRCWSPAPGATRPGNAT